MKIGPPPKTSVNHMRESLATGHLKSQTQKVSGKGARPCLLLSEEQSWGRTSTTCLRYQNTRGKKKKKVVKFTQFTRVLCSTGICIRQGFATVKSTPWFLRKKNKKRLRPKWQKQSLCLMSCVCSPSPPWLMKGALPPEEEDRGANLPPEGISKQQNANPSK